MKHTYPSWYFKYFDYIFKRTNYLEEIKLVNSIYPIVDKKILEIGAGKGYHTEEIIKLNPSALYLIDYQKEAINILNNKFSFNSKIKIIESDAFKLSVKERFDLILIFYSVLPQVDSISEFKNRVSFLFDRLLEPKGILAFEYVDYEKSLEIYPKNKKSLLIKRKGTEVYINSLYNDNLITIEYFGIINNDSIKYCVNLLRLNKSIIDLIASELKLQQFVNLSFDKYGRRRISFLKKEDP